MKDWLDSELYMQGSSCLSDQLPNDVWSCTGAIAIFYYFGYVQNIIILLSSPDQFLATQGTQIMGRGLWLGRCIKSNLGKFVLSITHNC